MKNEHILPRALCVLSIQIQICPCLHQAINQQIVRNAWHACALSSLGLSPQAVCDLVHMGRLCLARTGG